MKSIFNTQEELDRGLKAGDRDAIEETVSMTTPRIEEMVEEGQKIVCDYLDEVRRLLAGLPSEVKPHTFTKWLRKALTQAHQAGFNEGYKQGKLEQ